MQSTCNNSAASATRATLAARFAKSAARIDGATLTMPVTLPGSFEHENEHAVRARGRRYEERAPAVAPPRGAGRIQCDEVGQLRRRERVDTQRLDPRERADGIDEASAGAHRARRAHEQRALQVREVGR